MDLNTILTELVVLADDLDGSSPDISADVDAAIFIMSSESSLPRNKSLATVVAENYASVKGMSDEASEQLAITAAGSIASLIEEAIAQTDTAAVVAVLTSVAQSLKSVLHPNSVLSVEAARSGSEFLTAAENKLSLDEELHTVGYRVGLIRSKIEND